jgi:hypothetical protein
VTPIEKTERAMTAERIALWIGLVAVALIVWWMVDWVATPLHEVKP